MLWMLLALVYVQTGFQLGKKAAKTWKKGDSDSLESFLLFPVSHARGKVGDAGMPFMGSVNDGETVYRVLIALGWPAMVAWNMLLVLGLLGPDKIIRRLTSGPPTYEERMARILEEEKKVDRDIKRLTAGERTRKRAPKKAKALPAPPAGAATPPAVFAPPPPASAPSQPAVFEPPPHVNHGWPVEGAEPSPAQRDEPTPSPFQVRVTVDVTASEPAAEEAGRAEEEPRVNTAPDKEHVVH